MKSVTIFEINLFDRNPNCAKLNITKIKIINNE